MWNPFRKKPDTFLESLKHHITHKPKPIRYTMRNISLGVILLFLLGGILFPMFKKISQPPTFHEPTNIISGEITPNKDKEDVSMKPGEICVRHPSISFFMYHYIRDDDPKDNTTTHNLSVPPGVFREEMQIVHNFAQSGSITLMNGDDFMKSYKAGCFPGSPVWIFTSDDGWQDAYTNLVPVAHEYSIPFFLGIIGNRIGQNGFVSSGEILDMIQDPLFTVSSHSMNHHDESEMSGEQEYHEMCDSKKLLEQLTGKTVDTYIYPSGKMGTGGTSGENLTKCGYTLAWTTSLGKNFSWDDLRPYEIDRIRISHDTKPEIFRDILQKYIETESGGIFKKIE